MNWQLKNGVLFAGGKRIILAHVTSYSVDVQVIMVCSGVGREAINSGAESMKIAEALDEYFTAPGHGANRTP